MARLIKTISLSLSASRTSHPISPPGSRADLLISSIVSHSHVSMDRYKDVVSEVLSWLYEIVKSKSPIYSNFLRFFQLY